MQQKMKLYGLDNDKPAKLENLQERPIDIGWSFTKEKADFGYNFDRTILEGQDLIIWQSLNLGLLPEFVECIYAEAKTPEQALDKIVRLRLEKSNVLRALRWTQKKIQALFESLWEVCRLGIHIGASRQILR